MIFAALLLLLGEGGFHAAVVGGAVVAGTGGAPLSASMADVVSARVLKEHGMDRGLLLLNAPLAAEGEAGAADALVQAIDDAFANGKTPQSNFALCGATLPLARPIEGKIAGVYQVVELPGRGADPLTDPGRRRVRYAVQAIAFGRNFTLIALGSEPPADFAAELRSEFSARHPIVTGCANDALPAVWTAEERSLIRRTVDRVIARLR